VNCYVRIAANSCQRWFNGRAGPSEAMSCRGPEGALPAPTPLSSQPGARAPATVHSNTLVFTGAPTGCRYMTHSPYLVISKHAGGLDVLLHSHALLTKCTARCAAGLVQLKHSILEI
jgi:hypothetical protein